MPRIQPSTLVAATLVFVASCASAPVAQDVTVSRIDVDSHRLLAELAFADQRFEDAADSYLNAALASDDPIYAERAAQLARELGLDTVGHRAVRRWRELEPDNTRVDYFAGIFQMRSGRADDAVENFARVLETLPESSLGAGFGLIFEALASEPDVGTSAQIMLELTSMFPATAQGHYGLAQLALRAGAFRLALEESMAAIELSPEWPEARLLHARTLLLSGRSAEALEIASALADELDNPAVSLQYAELLLSAGETDRAETLLNQILDRNPGMPEAIRALAFLALAREDMDKAREQFEMLRNNPEFSNETFYYLGRIAELDGEYLQATRAYSRVTEGLRAVDAQARAADIMYQEMDDADSALRHLEEFGAANPSFRPEILLARAQLLLRLGRPEDGMALINQAIGDDPEFADASLEFAQINFFAALMQDALDRGDVEAANRWITEGLTRYPDNQTLRYSQTLLLQEQGELRKAVRALKDLVNESPSNPTFLNGLGYLLTDRLDRHDEARDYIQRALAMDPESGAILDSMGWVLFKLGDLEVALDYLERAYRALAVTEVLAHLVDVHWALGDRSLAREMLEEGLAESPDDSYLTEVRDRLLQ